MGKSAFESLAELFLKNGKTLDVQILGAGFATNTAPEKNQQEISARSKKKIHKLKTNFTIFAKMAIIRPLTPFFGLGQSSISSLILIRRRQMIAR